MGSSWFYSHGESSTGKENQLTPLLQPTPEKSLILHWVFKTLKGMMISADFEMQLSPEAKLRSQHDMDEEK